MKLIPLTISIIRSKGYSYATEKNYVHWIKGYIKFHKLTHPAEMGEKEIMMFLTHLATELNVSSTTQNQALNALAFLYKAVLKKDLGDFSTFARAKKPKLLPVILSREEVEKISTHRLFLIKIAKFYESIFHLKTKPS